MATLQKAIELAIQYHAGQTDKGGLSYIFHPLRVMEAVDGETHKIVAVLHDVVEDTCLTLEDLREYGFSDEVLEAISALTKQHGESRIDAAHRAAANPIARVVKLADLADNMDLSRLQHIGEKDRMRLEQYRQVKKILEQSCNII